MHVKACLEGKEGFSPHEFTSKRRSWELYWFPRNFKLCQPQIKAECDINWRFNWIRHL